MLQNAGLVAAVVAGAVAGEGLRELEGVVGGAVCERVDDHIIVGNHVGKEIDIRGSACLKHMDIFKGRCGAGPEELALHAASL